MYYYVPLPRFRTHAQTGKLSKSPLKCISNNGHSKQGSFRHSALTGWPVS